ncbi:hypothetical protein AB0L59_30255 [Streptomyces sp. NPDC052109]|uniref:hypothetical protein n=1 Tax=Streptomyces sp. NPDC052109 TaxID=3155527 RepID=UPI0034450D1A
MSKVTHTPALDTTPTRRALPYIPEQPGPVDTFDAGEIIAVLPGAVDEAMRKTLPGYYTPEKAAQIAAGAIAWVRAEFSYPARA